MSCSTITTLSTDLIRSHATLATDSGFPSRIPTITEPSGDGVISCGNRSYDTNNVMLFQIIGTGADDSTITGMRLIGWRKVQGGQSGQATQALWVPCILLEVAATLSSAVGVANAVLGTTTRFADTITVVAGAGNANVDYTLNSPANNTVAHGTIDYKGFQYIEATFDLGTATGAGILYATY